MNDSVTGSSLGRVIGRLGHDGFEWDGDAASDLTTNSPATGEVHTRFDRSAIAPDVEHVAIGWVASHATELAASSRNSLAFIASSSAIVRPATT
ncbi:MAG: hypothetical protein AB7G47_10040 [Mycolicibacterium sp.]|uniref:hypothetical protein n=1 Tax=Mycolicibacterium sp. TaxID=2320850 RepID=UPI003D0BD117